MEAKPFPFSQQYLLDHFDFDFDLGIVRQKGKLKLIFICKNKQGYLNGAINNKTYIAHRVIFFAYHNLQPKMIDHVDRNKQNNCIRNLRATTSSANSLNNGCYFLQPQSNGKYKALVRHNGKVVNLGIYDTLGEADFVTYYYRLDNNLLKPEYLENITQKDSF